MKTPLNRRWCPGDTPTMTDSRSGEAMAGRGLLAAAFAALGIAVSIPASGAPAARPNVLMIAVDDLNDWVGALRGHPQTRTPHIDRLAATGMAFTNAHCQAPICHPSRVSLLTGTRPSSTGM